MTDLVDHELNGSRWQHLKTGHFVTIIGTCQLEATNEPAFLYDHDGVIWARSMDQFLDGRFDRITPPATVPGAKGGEEAAPIRAAEEPRGCPTPGACSCPKPNAPREPTEAMLTAARDWSRARMGAPIGNDAARSCWQVMFDASDAIPTTPAMDGEVEAVLLEITAALENLFAMVQGEVPSLLEDHHAWGQITDAIEHANAALASLRSRPGAESPTPSGFNEGVEAALTVVRSYAEKNRFAVSDSWREDMTPSTVYETAAIDVSGWIENELLALRRADHKLSPIAPEPPVWRHDFNAYVPVQRSARSEADEDLAFAIAIAEEREACAVIADDDEGHFTWAGTDSGVKIRQQVAREIAAAIRARAAITALDAARGKS